MVNITATLTIFTEIICINYTEVIATHTCK